MKQNLSKEFVLVAGLAIFLGTVFLANETLAQENAENDTLADVCQHDPYPSETASLVVPCDDPSCNVGPCANAVEKNVDERKEARTQERAEQKEQRGTMLQERMQDRIVNLAANVTSRLESALNRFENITARLDSRIEKLEGLGVDASSAIVKLDDVKSYLTNAKEMLAGLDSVTEAVSGDSPREKFKLIRAEIKSIHETTKQVHEGLREVVALLKDAVRDAEIDRGVSEAVSNSENETEADIYEETIE